MPITVHDVVAQKVELRAQGATDVELAVFDGDTRTPLPGVEINRGNRFIAITGADGVARFRYFIGTHEVQITPHNEGGRVYGSETIRVVVDESPEPKRVGVALYSRPR